MKTKTAVLMARSGVKNPPPHDEWCHTHVNGHIPFSYMWTIHNFRARREKYGESLESSIFSAENNEQRVELQLSINLRGDEDDGDQNHLSLYLHIISCNGLQVKTDFQMSVLNAKQKVIYKLPLRNIIEKGSGFGWPKFIDRAVLKRYVPDDDLTLLCKGSIILEGTVNTSGKSNTVKFVVPECAALPELGQLLESCKFTDVTIFVCDEEINAHKAILAARSTVFSKMFETETEGAKKNRVEIGDIEPKVLREMIRFIYTGEAPNLEEMAAALIIAANKYDLGRLKVMCAEALFKSLSSGNAADTLILADQHNEKQLEVRTIDFINTNLKHVITTPSFKIMANSYPHLTEKILRRTTGWQEDSQCESDELPNANSESE